MRIRLLCVGRTRTKHLEEALAEYIKRLSPMVRLETDVIPASGVETESAMIMRRLKADDHVVLLDERGTLLSTPQLASMLQDLQNASVRTAVFVLGGAYGVDQSVIARADYTWSLSPLVFPHEMVRLLVTEQLYRAYDLNRGGKYHH
jgi:23S rRNA (pseudouridine1915-N3)-methyltransferase